jgi:hypothetical protein
VGEGSLPANGRRKLGINCMQRVLWLSIRVWATTRCLANCEFAMLRRALCVQLILIFMVLAVVILAFGQQAPGIYADQDGTLSELSPAPYSGTQSSSSVVKANIFWTFRGSHSPVQLSTNHPHFRLVCGHGSLNLLMLCGVGPQPSDLIIVRLDEKGDHREARTISGSMFGGHSGFDSKKTTTTISVKRDDGSWEVSPDKDLKAGEYLITTGIQPQGFDFGIQSGPK